MKNDCSEKTEFKIGLANLILYWSSLMNKNDFEKWKRGLNNQLRLLVRDKYIKNEFKNTEEMYLYAIELINEYYVKPWRTIIVRLD